MKKISSININIHKQTGVSLLESLIALLIFSGAWSNITHLLHQQTMTSFTHHKQILGLLQKQKYYEIATLKCKFSDCASLDAYRNTNK